mmetsp:Transcript_5875/g.18446  ORF Transcript_5875/g.18446 Transcript_5875/m.18446 type:complete len:365 (-) Transcript_5875:851-1945(-)
MRRSRPSRCPTLPARAARRSHELSHFFHNEYSQRRGGAQRPPDGARARGVHLQRCTPVRRAQRWGAVRLRAGRFASGRSARVTCPRQACTRLRETLSRRHDIIGARTRAQLSEKLRCAGRVQPQVVERLAQPLKALRNALARDGRILARGELREQADGALAVAGRALERAPEQLLRKLVVVGGNAQLVERTLRLVRILAHEKFVNHVLEHGLHLADGRCGGHRPRPPDARHAVRVVPDREQRLRALERGGADIVRRFRAQRVLDKGGSEHLVRDGAREEVAEKERRGGHVDEQVGRLVDQCLKAARNLRGGQRLAVEGGKKARNRLALLGPALQGDAHAALDHLVAEGQMHLALSQPPRHLAHV